MFPEPTELLLIGYWIKSTWTPKSKSSTLTPKNQLADILTKGNFTRDEWNHLLCLFKISHLSSAVCSEVMSKRTLRDSGEERVTAKSRPMMNLVSRCSEKTPVSFSTASESPGKTRHESQSPPSPQAEKYDRTVRPVVCVHSSSYSERNIDKTWSSQEWKSDELMDDRTGRPVVCSPFVSQMSSVEYSKFAQETQTHSSESEQVRILLDRQREQILADFQAEIRKHEFQADYDRRSIQKLNETIESQKANFRGGSREITIPSKSSYFIMVL